MRICRFDDDRIGVVEGESVRDVSAVLERLPTVRWPVPPGDLLVAHLDDLRPEMARLAADADPVPLLGVKLKSPVANPGKILAAPVNYQKHLAEARADKGIHFGGEVKTIADYGLFFKAPSSLVGPGEGVVVDRPERRTDHEIELAVVIGRQGRNITEREALAHVAGYCIGLDMVIRGTEDRSYRKSLDTFSVLGPWLVTADELGDPSALDFRLQVNGETRQEANTSDLVWGVAKLIAYASAAYTLQPGDVIMTGTPEGVGPVEPGDVMACWIERIGSMDVEVRAA
jgi:2-keto-4-pentenoate hydratase/2-oxohepta-3-ene-1,7-dioic acid hydratase in catechol pathway